MRCALFLVCALTFAGAARAEPTASALFVYRGAGCTGRGRLPQFEKLLGRKVDGVSDFIDNSSWATLEPSTKWLSGCWRDAKRLSLSVPMLPKKGSTLEQGAEGQFDPAFARLARILIDAGAADAYLRIGIEFNGNWFPWAAAANPPAYKAYFARIVRALRGASGANFQIVWNPTLGTANLDPELAYPGDDVVDVIAEDVYNQSWRAEDESVERRLENLVHQPHGLAWFAEFAKTHRKPMALPEWGTGRRPDGHGFGDDPKFIRMMATWIRAHSVVFHSYWDYKAPDYDAELSSGRYPESAAAFLAEFGAAAKK